MITYLSEFFQQCHLEQQQQQQGASGGASKSNNFYFNWIVLLTEMLDKCSQPPPIFAPNTANQPLAHSTQNATTLGVNYQSCIFACLNSLFNYINLAEMNTWAFINDELMRIVVNKYMNSSNLWNESLDLIKQAVNKSSSLTGYDVYNQSQINQNSLAAGGNADSATAVPVPGPSTSYFKKELPGRTLAFDFDYKLFIPQAATDPGNAKLPPLNLLNFHLYNNNMNSNLVNSSAKSTALSSGGWKRPHLSQARTRDRLNSLLSTLSANNANGGSTGTRITFGGAVVVNKNGDPAAKTTNDIIMLQDENHDDDEENEDEEESDQNEDDDIEDGLENTTPGGGSTPPSVVALASEVVDDLNARDEAENEEEDEEDENNNTGDGNKDFNSSARLSNASSSSQSLLAIDNSNSNIKLNNSSGVHQTSSRQHDMSTANDSLVNNSSSNTTSTSNSSSNKSTILISPTSYGANRSVHSNPANSPQIESPQFRSNKKPAIISPKPIYAPQSSASVSSPPFSNHSLNNSNNSAISPRTTVALESESNTVVISQAPTQTGGYAAKHSHKRSMNMPPPPMLASNNKHTPSQSQYLPPPPSYLSKNQQTALFKTSTSSSTEYINSLNGNLDQPAAGSGGFGGIRSGSGSSNGSGSIDDNNFINNTFSFLDEMDSDMMNLKLSQQDPPKVKSIPEVDESVKSKMAAADDSNFPWQAVISPQSADFEPTVLQKARTLSEYTSGGESTTNINSTSTVSSSAAGYNLTESKRYSNSTIVSPWPEGSAASPISSAQLRSISSKTKPMAPKLKQMAATIGVSSGVDVLKAINSSAMTGSLDSSTSITNNTMTTPNTPNTNSNASSTCTSKINIVNSNSNSIDALDTVVLMDQHQQQQSQIARRPVTKIIRSDSYQNIDSPSAYSHKPQAPAPPPKTSMTKITVTQSSPQQQQMSQQQPSPPQVQYKQQRR